MSTKRIGIGLIVVGLLIIVVALSAGYIGIAHSRTITPHKQMLAAFGLFVGIVGGILMILKKKA
jgi:hypothetical protein